MRSTVKKRAASVPARARVLGRGIGARRGVHLTLRALREAAGKTQAELSTASGIDQGDISRLEARENLDDSMVSTLRRYLAAIGADLELTAVFGGKRIVVVGAANNPDRPNR